MKRILGLIAAVLILWRTPPVSAAYADVPDNTLGAEVRKAIEYGLMNGFSGEVFGYSAPMTRAQFVTVLDRMLLYDEEAQPLPEAMELPETSSDVRRAALGRAVACGVVDGSVPFDGEKFVTREEMAEMLVKALGLNDAALALSSGQSPLSAVQPYAAPFQDMPKGKEGYASIAYVIGMTKGASGASFRPEETATRAQAAAMLVRIYEKLHQKTTFRHAFLPSDAQIDGAKQMDVVSLEWSRLTWSSSNALLTTTDVHQGRFRPENYKNIVETLTNNGVKLHLSVFMSVSDSAAELLEDEQGRAQAVGQILRELTSTDPALGRNPYSGVTIDFQGLHKAQRTAFTAFLSELYNALAPTGKTLYVCVAPYVSDGRWNDGYDCRALAAVADKLILTAYGYEAGNLNNFLGTKAYLNEASAPTDNVYLSLFHLTEAVPDASKLLLGFRFSQSAWEIDPDGKLVSGVPVSVGADALARILRSGDANTAWDCVERMPCAIYQTSGGTRYFVWYENAKSVRKKMEVARLLGVTGVSYSPLTGVADAS